MNISETVPLYNYLRVNDVLVFMDHIVTITADTKKSKGSVVHLSNGQTIRTTYTLDEWTHILHVKKAYCELDMVR